MASVDEDQSDRRALTRTSLELPAYIWEQTREYLNANPEKRFRNMVMAGFRELGLQVDDADLVAERKRGPAG